MFGSCYSRQAYIRYYQPYNIIPDTQELKKPVEFPLDVLKIKDEENIFSVSRNKIILEFVKSKDKNDINEMCFSRKILIGNCKLIDPKQEKNSNYEILMPVY